MNKLELTNEELQLLLLALRSILSAGRILLGTDNAVLDSLTAKMTEATNAIKD